MSTEVKEQPTTINNLSKDFVEHLRTVHFSLAALCIVLLVLGLTSKTAEVRNAAQELGSIIAVRDAWDPQWFCLTKLPDTAKLVQFPSGLEDSKQLLTPEKRIVPAGDDPTVLKPPHLTCTLPEEIRKPRFDTLADIRSLWTALKKHTLKAEVYFIGDLFVKRGTRTEKPTKSEVQKAHNLTSGSPSELLGDPKSLVAVVEDSTYSVQLWPETTDLSLEEVNIRWPKLKLADFDQAFPNLTAITRDLNNIGLNALLSDLLSETNKSDNSLEAFGVKLPADDISIWGIVLVIGSQIYLLIHLQALQQMEQKNDDSGWSVPWIGIYESRLARFSTWFSLVLLPILATITIGIRAALAEGRLKGFGEPAGILAASIIVGTLGQRIQRSLPRKSTITTVSQKATAATQAN